MRWWQLTGLVDSYLCLTTYRTPPHRGPARSKLGMEAKHFSAQLVISIGKVGGSQKLGPNCERMNLALDLRSGTRFVSLEYRAIQLGATMSMSHVRLNSVEVGNYGVHRES